MHTRGREMGFQPTGAGDFVEERRDVRVISTNDFNESNPLTSVTLGGSGVLKVLLHMQLTGAGDFGRERGDTTLQKTKLHIKPYKHNFFLPLPRNIFTNIFFLAFRWKKNIGL